MARIFHRNLFSQNNTNYPCTNFCDPSCGNFEDCYTFPESINSLPPLPPPLPPVSIIVSPDTITTQGVHISPLLIIIVIILASVFLLISYYAIVIKYCTFWNRVIIRQEHGEPPPSNTDQGGNHGTDALNQQNEDRVPVIDHPIWLISTIGLHQSVINSITMLRYKKDDGLIDGLDCSVCLSEFQEDETLRLLPKCKHAFHVDCIDTWLRSHTNCPLCRAGIVANSGRPSLASNEPGLGQSRRAELNPIFDSDSSDVELGRSPTINRSEVVEHMDAGNVNFNDQSKDEVECKAILRRSFSMDFFRGPNLQRNNSNSSSSQVMDGPSSLRPRPLGPPSMKRSYSWSDRVFWSSRILNNGNRNISP